MTPLISVVIPAFNRRMELKRALESLTHQTSKNFEIIVCDDGSSEDLRSIVDAFVPSLDIYYIRIENSGGPARPRNTAVAKARGEWVSFLDSDDWWDEDRIARVESILQADVDFVYHPLRVVTATQVKGRRERRGTIGEPLRCEALTHMALFGNPIPNSAAVVRRNLLDKIGGICEDHNLVALEDFDTWMRLAEVGVTPRFIEQPLGSYWIGEDGISNITERHILRQITLFDRHRDRFDSAIRSMAESRQDYVLGTMLMHLSGRQREARAHFLRGKTLPTRSMQLKRLFKIILTFKI